MKSYDLNVEGNTATVSGKRIRKKNYEEVVLVIGNTEGIVSVDDRITVVIEELEAQFYTVVKGDYLSEIAKKTLS